MTGLKLIQIEGIGPVYADKLLKVGIETTDELLLVDPNRVAKRTGMPYTLIEAWQDMADLLRILGVGPEYAEALNKIGIDSCPAGAEESGEHPYQASGVSREDGNPSHKKTANPKRAG